MSSTTHLRTEKTVDQAIAYLEVFEELSKFLLAKHPEVLEEFKEIHSK